MDSKIPIDTHNNNKYAYRHNTVFSSLRQEKVSQRQTQTQNITQSQNRQSQKQRSPIGRHKQAQSQIGRQK